MPDPSEFIPIKQESIASIRARLDADANTGLTPDDDGYLDLTHGGFWWDLTQAPALEMERLWDFAATELPAATFLYYSYGEYLDDHGEALSTPRKDQVAATGTVRFSGTAGTIISPGTQVAAPTTRPEAEEVTFQVIGGGGTIPGTAPATGTLDLSVQAMEAGALGNVPALAVELLLTPVDGVTAVSNPEAIGGGSDVENDDAYRERLLLEMSAQGGGGTVSQFERWALAVPGVGFVTVQPLPAGPGTVRVMVRDMQGKPVSAEVLRAVQNDLDPPVADALSVGAHTLPLGGAAFTVDSTTGFRDSGRFYVLGGQIVSYTGRTATTFTGCQGGSGSVLAGTAVYQGGAGLGRATIGVDVVVGTPAPLNITITATVFFETGYSLAGDPGTIGTEADMEKAIEDYINNLDVGEDVVLNHVEARMFRVRGVYDVSGAQINGAAANLAVSNEQVAVVQTITLTQG
jgi:uncharacterized phage protein gp47/JayE